MEKKYKIGMYINVALTIIALLVVLAPIVGIGTDSSPKPSEAQMQMEAPENGIPEIPAEDKPQETHINSYVFRFANIGMILLVAYYAIKGYKKSHGNLLRLTMLAFAATQVLQLGGTIKFSSGSSVYMQALVILCTAYMAGRLNKIEKNKYIAVLVLALLIYIAVTSAINDPDLPIIRQLSIFTPVIVWIDICFAYFLRYKEHKEADLEDAPKN